MMSSGDDDDLLDRVLGELVSDKLVAMMESSPNQPKCSQNLLGFVPAPTNNAGSTAELSLSKERTGKLRGGVLCLGATHMHF